MTTLRPFSVHDLFKFNNVNMDVLTETYDLSFYGTYLLKWPEYCVVMEAPSAGTIMGYILGKAEGQKESWHGHVTVGLHLFIYLSLVIYICLF